MDLVVVAHQEELDQITRSTEEDPVGQSSSNFPEALVKVFQAEPKGKLPGVKGLDEAFHAPFEAWNEMVTHDAVLAPAGQ